MNKVILFLALGLMLIASPSIASECADGKTWQSNITPGYFETTSECKTWSVPTCGWQRVGHHWNWVCSTPNCLEYKQVWHEAVDAGACVSLGDVPVVSKPTCERGFEYKGEYTAGFYTLDVLTPGYWTGRCESTGGISYLQLAPMIKSITMGNNRVASILFSKFGTCSLLLREVDDRIDTFPIGNENIMQTWGFSSQQLDYYSVNNQWGYKYKIDSHIVGTNHSISIPMSVASGKYKARAACYTLNSLAPVFSQEQEMIVR